jgi:hypothetical protein
VRCASRNQGWLELAPLTGEQKNKRTPINLLQNAPPYLVGGAVFSNVGNLVRKTDPARQLALLDFRLPNKLRRERDIAFFPQDNLLMTLVPMSEKSALVEIRDSTTGQMLSSAPILIDRKQGREWQLTAHPQSNQMAVSRGAVMKV